MGTCTGKQGRIVLKTVGVEKFSLWAMKITNQSKGLKHILPGPEVPSRWQWVPGRSDACWGRIASAWASPQSGSLVIMRHICLRDTGKAVPPLSQRSVHMWYRLSCAGTSHLTLMARTLSCELEGYGLGRQTRIQMPGSGYSLSLGDYIRLHTAPAGRDATPDTLSGFTGQPLLPPPPADAPSPNTVFSVSHWSRLFRAAFTSAVECDQRAWRYN